MWTIASYTLLAVGSVLSLTGGFLFLQRWIATAPISEDATAAHRRVDELEIIFESFRAQYELENTRSLAKLGKLRRQLARERGEEEEEVVASSEPTVHVATKDDLRRQWRERQTA